MKFKKLFSSFIASLLVAAMMMSGVSAADVQSHFEQNTNTTNTYGFIDDETDAFEVYSDVKTDGISSKIYKPVSGDTLIVTFHGNGEGGISGLCNNYSQISANRLAVTYASADVQEAFKGAYVLAFQAPDEWYNDYSEVAMKVIDQAKEEFNVNQVFVSGLSAGGMMSERMLAKYGNYFSGALFSCAAIAKNGQKVEGLGGEYATVDEDGKYTGEYLNKDLNLYKPVDYDTYVANYETWLKAIAESNVPIFMVHAKNDPTISSEWTVMAYNYIKDYRDANELDGEIHYSIIDTVNYADTAYSEHWSWIKMLNNDITALDDPQLSTMSWFESLSTSTNTYVAKTVTTPTAGASNKADTYQYNLIAQVKDDGQKVIAIEIDMNGKEVDASKLTNDMFKVTGYNTDASGVANTQDASYGLFGSENEPVEIEVSKVSVNDRGNIVLELATVNGVLNYTAPSLRNLATNMRYSIADVALPFVGTEEKPTTTQPDKDTNTAKPVSTGDETLLVQFGALALLSAGLFISLKKKRV